MIKTVFSVALNDNLSHLLFPTSLLHSKVARSLFIFIDNNKEIALIYIKVHCEINCLTKGFIAVGSRLKRKGNGKIAQTCQHRDTTRGCL